MCELVTQECLTLCDPMDYKLPGSSIHGILQAKILVWVAICFSRGSSWLRDWTQVSCVAGRFFTIQTTREALLLLLLLLSRFSHVQLCATPWTAAHQASPSLGFSRQKHWSGLPFPSPGDLPDSGIEPRSPALQADSLPFELPGIPSDILGLLRINFKTCIATCIYV